MKVVKPTVGKLASISVLTFGDVGSKISADYIVPVGLFREFVHCTHTKVVHVIGKHQIRWKNNTINVYTVIDMIHPTLLP